jgi:hypothetical protein
MEMPYKSAAALEMALKSAAKQSPTDTGRAISGFYFHVFANLIIDRTLSMK